MGLKGVLLAVIRKEMIRRDGPIKASCWTDGRHAGCRRLRPPESLRTPSCGISDTVTGHLLENAKQYAQHSYQPCQSGWRCGNTPGGNPCKLELVDTGQPVEHGADADTRRSTGKTPTIPSAKDGEDILRRLSSHENVNVSQKDMNNRDAQSWACVSGSWSVVKRVVTKMQGIGEWRTRCSAALPHVLTSEAPDALLNALHRHEDDGRRAEMRCSRPLSQRQMETLDITAGRDPRGGWPCGSHTQYSKFKVSVMAKMTPSHLRWDIKKTPYAREV